MSISKIVWSSFSSFHYENFNLIINDNFVTLGVNLFTQLFWNEHGASFGYKVYFLKEIEANKKTAHVS